MFPFRSNYARVLSAAGRHREALEALHTVELFLADDPNAAEAEVTRIRELLKEAYAASGDDEAAACYE